MKNCGIDLEHFSEHSGKRSSTVSYAASMMRSSRQSALDRTAEIHYKRTRLPSHFTGPRSVQAARHQLQKGFF
jgi:hypothetical protein